MATPPLPHVYMESLEEMPHEGKEPNQVWYIGMASLRVGEQQQEVLASCQESDITSGHRQRGTTEARLAMSDGLSSFNSPRAIIRNRRMPNGTYGGVRGR